MTPRKKPGVAFWATVVVVVALVGYPLSFGPVCRLIERRFYRDEIPILPEWACSMYSPLGSLACNGPEFVRAPFVWYLSLFIDGDGAIPDVTIPDLFPLPCLDD